MIENPYTVLNLPINIDFNKVRLRYYELARRHHPDKLPLNTSDEEKKKHEEIFKKVTAAYHKIENEKNGIGSDDKTTDWQTIWKSVDAFFSRPETWETMKTIFKKVATLNRSIHNIRVPVTLEDVHLAKKKKLRLILLDIEEPIFITINAGEYPHLQIIHIIRNYELEINLTLQIQEHLTFRLFQLLDRMDLFYHAKITIKEYINGTKLQIDFLDTQKLDVNVPAFYDTKLPLLVKDKGLCERGDLFIIIEIVMPVKEQISRLNKEDYNNFITVLDAIYT
jgi:hypothetical protein